MLTPQSIFQIKYPDGTTYKFGFTKLRDGGFKVTRRVYDREGYYRASLSGDNHVDTWEQIERDLDSVARVVGQDLVTIHP